MRGLYLAFVGLAAGSAMVLFQQDSVADSSFLETFDGAPLSPQPFDSPHWDVQVHERRQVEHAPGWMPSMQAQHGPGCEGPTVSHTVNTVADSVFRCKDHVMTALNGPDYGVIYLTPDHMLDWSGGTGVLQWDMSTEKMSTRDWPDILITPFADNLALPLASGLAFGVDLQGPPRNGVHIGMDNSQGAPILGVRVNGAWVGDYGPTWAYPALGDDVAAGTDESATRQTFKLTLTATSAKFERLASATAPALVFWNHSFAALPFSSGVVQFGHHSYSPDKDGAGVPATWHWDAVSISPAIPFHMSAVSPEYITNTTAQTVTFAPAPTGAYLRFAAWGNTVRVNGVQYQPVFGQTNDTLKAYSYSVPIPAGTTSATVQLSNSPSGVMGKGFSVWSMSTSGGTATPTVPATATDTPTITPAPPSSTPTTIPPSSTPTATRTPTATASPTQAVPTATPPSCRVRASKQLPSGAWESERWYFVDCGSLRTAP